MTDEHNELRRTIAEARGWRVEYETEPIRVFGERDVRVIDEVQLEVWIAPDGKRYKIGTALTASRMYPFPNWPNDLNAALELCLEIAQRRGWGIYILPRDDDEGAMADFMRWRWEQDGRWEVMRYESEYDADEDTAALALSRLALAALTGEA